MLLNDEMAAILEILELGAASTEAVSVALADDSGVMVETIEAIVESSWPSLIDAGLVRELGADNPGPLR